MTSTNQVDANELLELIRKWGRDREINDPFKEVAKIVEELGEASREINRFKFEGKKLKDALGDTMVALTILADICGYDIEKCLAFAYEEIKDRHGESRDGTFIKAEMESGKNGK